MEKRMTKTLMRAATLLPLAGLLMGNTECSSKPQRELRKIVDLGRIQTPPMQIISGQNFDFSYVANQQIYGVMMQSNGFALRYNPPLVVGTNGAAQLNLSQKDAALFSKVMGNKVNDPVVNWSKDASCLVFLPQAKIYGSINSFEAVGGGGIQIGYNPVGIQAPGLPSGSLGFKLEYAQLDLSMHAIRPLTNGLMGSVNVDSKRSRMDFNLSVNFGPISLGPSGWYQTPLAQVTENGLKMAVNDLKDALVKEEWYTRVLVNHDNYLTIIGGTTSGLEKGDELAIYNETYYWDGEPCGSTYRGGGATDPVALGVVDTVSDEITIVKITKQTDENAVVGAKVKLLKFHDEETTKESTSTPKADGMTDARLTTSPNS